ncbi:MAG: hypothetical protein Q8J65_04235 [Nitrosomonadales bacterium]|nr:hypothetical protein [Nitrosomonadales bacterium]
MQHSADRTGKSTGIAAECLYVANLTVLPVIGFLILLWLYFSRITKAPALASCHLKQTVSASIWAGGLLILINVIVLVIGGYNSPHAVAALILYIFTVHSTLIILGVIGLSKALAGQKFKYPLIGGAV